MASCCFSCRRRLPHYSIAIVFASLLVHVVSRLPPVDPLHQAIVTGHLNHVFWTLRLVLCPPSVSLDVHLTVDLLRPPLSRAGPLSPVRAYHSFPLTGVSPEQPGPCLLICGDISPQPRASNVLAATNVYTTTKQRFVVMTVIDGATVSACTCRSKNTDASAAATSPGSTPGRPPSPTASRSSHSAPALPTFSSRAKTLTFWYNNCRSVRNIIVDLHAHLSTILPNTVVLLTETWLDASVNASELFDTSGYTVLRKDRCGRGGGILMAFPTSAKVNRRLDLEHDDPEALFVELILPHSTVLVCCAYCPPSLKDEAFKHLDSSLSLALSKQCTNVLVFGNFNAHIDWTSHDDPLPHDRTDDLLLDVMTSANPVQACLEPTYSSRDGTSSSLDLVFLADPTRVTSCTTSEGLSNSDHRAIELDLSNAFDTLNISLLLDKAKESGIRGCLLSEGPVTKSVEQWQDWWRKQVHDASQDAAAFAEVQRSTGGGRAPGFHGRVLQHTGTLRLTGVLPLDYQQVHMSRRQLQPPRL
ncbi:hypothetical protein MTO96_022556 [Rhipicephalus appendiculatus]